LVAYIEALLVLSPYGRPSDLSITVIADAHFNEALVSFNVLLDTEFRAYMGCKADKFFKAYGFVARAGEDEDEDAAAAAATTVTAAEAAAAAKVLSSQVLIFQVVSQMLSSQVLLSSQVASPGPGQPEQP
jgi:hypothetical protein